MSTDNLFISSKVGHMVDKNGQDVYKRQIMTCGTRNRSIWTHGKYMKNIKNMRSACVENQYRLETVFCWEILDGMIIHLEMKLIQ